MLRGFAQARARPASVWYNSAQRLLYLDYFAIMGLFIFIGHYLTRWLRRFPTRKMNKQAGMQ